MLCQVSKFTDKALMHSWENTKTKIACFKKFPRAVALGNMDVDITLYGICDSHFPCALFEHARSIIPGPGEFGSYLDAYILQITM